MHGQPEVHGFVPTVSVPQCFPGAGLMSLCGSDEIEDAEAGVRESWCDGCVRSTPRQPSVRRVDRDYCGLVPLLFPQMCL